MKDTRVEALERRLSDLETRHAEAIALLVLAISDLQVAPVCGMQSVEHELERFLSRIEDLVPAASERALDELAAARDAEIRAPKRLGAAGA
jgi:uncharacterized coiled-coil protein SlyX